MRANSIWEVTVNARTIIFLQPVFFKKKILGAAIVYTRYLVSIYRAIKIGEDWAISAHPHGVSTVFKWRI